MAGQSAHFALGPEVQRESLGKLETPACRSGDCTIMCTLVEDSDQTLPFPTIDKAQMVFQEEVS